MSSNVDPDKSNGVIAEFRLLGIAFSNNPEQTVAVISTGPDRHQRFIHEGDSIGQVKVKRILSDQVVFETDQGERIAKMNVIYLGDNKAGGSSLSEKGNENSLPTRLRRNQTVEIDRKKVSSYLVDIDKVIRDVKISPVKVYGRPVGVRISPVEPGSLFDEIGLKNGDIIRAVNGKPIEEHKGAVTLFESLRSGGEFDILVKGTRYSRTIQLIVN